MHSHRHCTFEMPRIVIWPNTEYRIFGYALGRSAEHSATECSAKDVCIKWLNALHFTRDRLRLVSLRWVRERNTNETDKNKIIEIHDSFWNCFEEVATDNMQNDEDAEKSTVANEIDFYLKTVRLNRTADPYKWWSANAKSYPILKQQNSLRFIYRLLAVVYIVRGYFQKRVLFMKKSAIVCYQQMLKKLFSFITTYHW